MFTCAIAAAAIGGCGKPSIRREAGLNVLLITVDTLRADAVGAYGNTRVSTPFMDRLSAQGVRFTHALAHNVVTLPSHANILSGRYPLHHGVRENSGFRFPADVDTLATVFKRRGYATGAFVSAFPLDVRFGLGRGFDTYDDRYGKGAEHRAFREPERPGAETVAAARAWIDRQPAPWFAWVHVYEPHFPYAPPEPFASRYASDPYLGEVSAADAALARLAAPLVDQGANGRTLIVLTADHGESLGDHGELTHGLFAYDSTLHVPLILYEPRLFAPRVVSDPVRHVDIMPTVLDAMGIEPPPGLDGTSLLAKIAGAGTAHASYFESLSTSLNRGWAPLFGLVDGSLKYVDLPIPELYDLSADPREEHNLAASRSADVQRLAGELQQMRAGDRGIARIAETAETRERLRSLGYVSGSAEPRKQYTVDDDPKRLVALDRLTDEMVTKYQSGDLRGAIATGEELARKRPDMASTLTHLAFLYNEAGNHPAAVAAITRAAELNPSAPDIVSLLGAYLTEAGLAKEAVERLQPYMAAGTPDLDVVIAYGVALAGVGRGSDALAAFARARSLDATSGVPLVDIGTVYLMNGDEAKAAAAFQEAIALDPGLARAHNGLGVLAARHGRFDEAAAHWKRAVDIDPHDYQALYNLGSALIRLGRPAEAREYWSRYLTEAPRGLEAEDRARVEVWLKSYTPASR